MCAILKTCAFSLSLVSDEGYYQSGKFQFEIDVPEAYNMVVSCPVNVLLLKDRLFIDMFVVNFVPPVYLCCH